MKILNVMLGKFSSNKAISYKPKADGGFAVLFSVLVASLLLSIGLAIFNIAFKESVLTSQARESQSAFYAADAAAECTLFWDTQHPSLSSSPFGSWGDSVNITSGLAAHWRMNDGTGSPVATDSKGGNHATLFGMDPNSDWVTGKSGTALDFDGSNDYAAINELVYTEAGEIGALSVCAWIRTTDDRAGIVDFDRSEYWSLGLNFHNAGGQGGRVSWDTRGESTGVQDLNSNTSVSDGEWHHVCGVYDSSQVTDKRIYIDGVLDTSDDAHNTGEGLGRGTDRFGFIGDGSEASDFNGSRNSVYFGGTLDSVRIYNRPLSAGEVVAVMAQDALVAHWTLNEGSGTVVNDVSGGGNGGTLVGSESSDWVSGKIGTAIKFDSDGEYLSINDPSAFQFDEYTYAFFIYPTEGPTGGFRRIIVNGNGPVNNGRAPGFWFVPNDMRVHFAHSNSEGSQVALNSSFQPSLNTWTHVAGVSTGDSGQLRFYFNGNPNTSRGHNDDLVTLSGQNFRISNSGSDDFGGRIDDVRVYSIAVPQGEIARLANLGVSQNYTPPIGQNAELYCKEEDITNPLSGWDTGSGWVVSDVTSTGGTTVFDMAFDDGSCATVTVVKDNGATTVDSRGYNTCTLSDPHRIERGLRVEY